MHARQLALKQMSVDPQLPEAAPLALPFDQEGSDQTKPEVEDKPRLLKVTVDRIIRFGPTPGCANCKVWTGKVHTPECRARIDSLVRAEQDAAWKRKKEELAAKKSANLEDEALDDEVEILGSEGRSSSSNAFAPATTAAALTNTVQGGIHSHTNCNGFCDECLEDLW